MAGVGKASHEDGVTRAAGGRGAQEVDAAGIELFKDRIAEFGVALSKAIDGVASTWTMEEPSMAFMTLGRSAGGAPE